MSFFGFRSSASSRRRHHSHSVEALESRTLLTSFLVTNVNDAGSGSLRAAIISANGSPGQDLIRFDESLTGATIALDSSLPYITDPVVIRGSVRSFDAITIDGQLNPGVRPISIDPSAGLVRLTDMTITGGNTTGQAFGTEAGGGLLNEGPNTQLLRVRVKDNFSAGAQGGGGVAQTVGGSMSIRHSEIVGNIAEGRGGGIANDGTLVLGNSTVANNQAFVGGGVDASASNSSQTTIRFSTIENNRTAQLGGGVSARGNTLIDRSLVAHNVASSGTGGVHQLGESLVILNSTIAYNTALTGDDATGGITVGGALNATTTIVNSTIVRNWSLSDDEGSAGGIWLTSLFGLHRLDMYNSVVAENFAAGLGATTQVDRSLMFDDIANIVSDGNVRLGTLRDNGGPTFTLAPLPGSILIDAGDNQRATPTGQPGTPFRSGDQRRLSRFIDGNQDVGMSGDSVTVDVGAVEFNPAPDQFIVTGTDAGNPARVTIYNQDGTLRWTRLAFGPTFTGGVRVAKGDFDGDGIADVIAGEGPGGKSRFRVFNGINGRLMTGRSPFGKSYDGGIFVASADFNGDGRDDVVAGSGGGMTARVRVRNAANPDQNLRNLRVGTASDFHEVRVAAGDVNSDGVPDILATLTPEVIVFDGSVVAFLPPALHRFTPFGSNFNGPMTLAAGNVDEGPDMDLIVGRGVGGPPRVRIYAGNSGPLGGTPTLMQEIMAGDQTSNAGVRVAAATLDGDKFVDIVTASGSGGRPIIRTIWSFADYTTTATFSDAILNSDDGLFVAV